MARFSTTLIASLVAIPLAVSPAAAAMVDEPTRSCTFSAHTIDLDPAGTNIRSAPNATALPLARLPREAGEGDAAFSPEFEVIGFKKGWFLIKNAAVGHYGDEPVRTIFKGPGWVSAKLVGFTINNHRLYDAPDSSAKVVGELIGADWGPDSAIVKEVHDCSGAFVNVTLETPDGAERRGWATGLCANQVTTCP